MEMDEFLFTAVWRLIKYVFLCVLHVVEREGVGAVETQGTFVIEIALIHYVVGAGKAGSLTLRRGAWLLTRAHKMAGDAARETAAMQCDET